MLKYILFDLDGTLSDSSGGITEAVDRTLRDIVGIETADRSTLLPYIGPPLREGFMQNHHLDPDTALRCQTYCRAYYTEHGLLKNRVYDGIPEALDRLRSAGLTLAVATSKQEGASRHILDHFGLTEKFTDIVGSTPDNSISDKAEVVRETLRRLGNPDPDTVLMIGDRKYDINGAHANNLRAMGVLFGFGSREELAAAGAEYIAETPAQTADMILDLLK